MADHLSDYGKYLTDEKHSSANTVSSYLRDVSQFAEYLRSEQNCCLEDAKPEMVQSYMSWMMSRGKSPSSVTRFLASVKSFYSYLLSVGAVESNPAKNVTAARAERKYPEILTSREVELFL